MSELKRGEEIGGIKYIDILCFEPFDEVLANFVNGRLGSLGSLGSLDSYFNDDLLS
jgi:hypothetical protein